jgi:hypothetical protein
MGALFSQFGTSLVLTLVTVLITVIASVVVARRASSEGLPALQAAVRVLAIGAGLAIIVATALPQQWPPRISSGGDLVLELGRGGLREWRSILEAPTSWTAVLMLANVAVYVPLGFLGVLGWPNHKLRVLVAGLAISLLVEISQFTISDRVAATDDMLLNATGLLLGWLLGVVAFALARWIGDHRSGGQESRREHGAPADS